jgi:hypothetical protein
VEVEGKSEEDGRWRLNSGAEEEVNLKRKTRKVSRDRSRNRVTLCYSTVLSNPWFCASSCHYRKTTYVPRYQGI